MDQQNSFSQGQFADGQNVQVPRMPDGGVPVNVINAVNANGIVTGEKVVSYIWKRVGICAMILAAACVAAVVVAVIILGNVDRAKNELEQSKIETETNLGAIYESLGVERQADAITQINNIELLNGGDIDEIDALLEERYGEDYDLDIADQNINFIRKSGAYRIASFGVRRSSGSERAIMYERISDGVWMMSGFDSTEVDDPCQGSSKEDKAILEVLNVCDTGVENK